MKQVLTTLFLVLAVTYVWSRNAVGQDLTPEHAHELKEIERRLEQRAEEEARLKDEAKQKAQEVKSLRQRMIEAADAIQQAEQRIIEIRAEVERLEKEEHTLKQSLEAQQANLGDVLAALQSLERSRPPAILVTPESASTAARTALLLTDAAPELEARAATLKNSLDSLRKVRAALTDERVAFEKTNQQVNDRRTVLADLLREKQRERDVAARLARAAQTETAALAARATSLRGILTRLEKFARAITPRLKPDAPLRSLPKTPSSSPTNPASIPTPNTAPREVPAAVPGQPAARLLSPQPSLIPRVPTGRPFKAARGTLNAPVVGDIIGKFGQLRPEGGKFEGVRFSVADKAIVTAPFEGNVVFARSWGPVGNLIVVDVADGYHILMMGVTGFLVEEGQRVRTGEPIGTMAGAAATLELEIRKDGEPVNPSLWLSGKIKAE